MPDLPNPLDQIEHIIVLMLENRSFDNLLGWLYDPNGNRPPFNQPPPDNFDGLYGKNLSNPGPNGSSVPVGKGSILTDPNPDPGEGYEEAYSQLYDVPAPLLADVPPDPPQPPAMQGFVSNYAAQSKVISSGTDPSLIMNCFTPAAVPVISSLAYYYGVCDHWFASIPTETYCNRSYVHAGTSSGYVNNKGGDDFLFDNDTTTIFNLLEESQRSWKIYHGSWLITSLALLTQKKLWPYALDPNHFGHVSDFIKDAKRPGGLPSYAFIEPIYLDSLVWGPENDMHPEANPFEFYGPSNIEQGEKLLSEVYQAVRTSPDWHKTMLIITFDEHGGCYDHVPPPPAEPPDHVVIPSDQPGGSGFRFNRLGVRVPAIIVSPFTKGQTVINEVFDHTSILRTVVERFELPKEQLGKREAKAQDLSCALNLRQARTDHPPIAQPSMKVIHELARPLSAMHQAVLAASTKPLSDFQRSILAATARRLGQPESTQAEIAQLQTALQAETFLMKQEAKLLGRKLEGRLAAAAKAFF